MSDIYAFISNETHPVLKHQTKFGLADDGNLLFFFLLHHPLEF